MNQYILLPLVIYIYNLIKNLKIVYSLCYQNTPLLIIRNSGKTSLNSRAFKNTDHTLWNSLPPTIRSTRSIDLYFKFVNYKSMTRSQKRFINLTYYFLSTYNH